MRLCELYQPYMKFMKYKGLNIEEVQGIRELKDKSTYNSLWYKLPDGLVFHAKYEDDDYQVNYFDEDGKPIGYAYDYDQEEPGGSKKFVPTDELPF